MSRSFRRIIASFMCIMILIGMTPHSVVQAIGESDINLSEDINHGEIELDKFSAWIECEDKEVTAVDFSKSEKKEFTAVSNEYDGLEYKWQILINNSGSQSDTWADIKEMNSDKCTISYAMIKEMLSSNNTCFIRCGIKKGQQDYVYSQRVEIYISEDNVINKDINDLDINQVFYDDNEKKSISSVLLRSGLDVIRNLESSIQSLSSKSNSEYATVTIKYLFADGTTAFDPYVASLVKGTDFTSSVQSPTVVGYNPWIIGSDGNINADTVELNYPDLQSDKEVTVTYLPKEVSYSVRYYFQNIIDDSYTEDLSKYKQLQGVVGTSPVHNEAFDGFEKVETETAKIAADGSTEFQMIYDRCYYLIQFDMDGGYGVEPIYAKYGTSFIVSDPLKEGYTFAGWDIADSNGNFDGIRDEMPQRVPSYNMKCKAIWEKATSSYTVIYWKQNADDDNYSYWSSKTVENMETETIVSGKDDLNRENTDEVMVAKEIVGTDNKTTTISVPLENRFEKDYFHLGWVDEGVMVEGDGSTVVNVYYDRNVYNIKYYYAKMNKTDNKKYISLDTGNGVYTGVFNREITPSDNGWNAFINGAEVEDNTDGFYYYYFEIENKKYGQKIADVWPANGPISGVYSIGGQNFVSWATENGTPYRNNHSQKNIKGAYDTLAAEMIKEPTDSLAQSMMAYFNSNASAYTYKIYFQNVENEEYPNTPSMTYNIRSTANGKGQDAYAYSGFTYKIKEYADGASESGMGGTVKFYYTRNTYKAVFMNAGHEESEKEFKYGASVRDAYYEPVYPDEKLADAYEFGGWYTTENCADGSQFDFDSATMPADNILLYSKWTLRTYNVTAYGTYDDLLNKRGSSQIINGYDTGHYTALYGSPVVRNGSVEINVPNREGYTFLGWFYINYKGEKEAFDFEQTPVYRDMEVFADWHSDKKVNYRISYVTEDGTKIADDTVGTSFAGTTKTFTAKTGTSLYDEYQMSYYPETSSHSIVMAESSDGSDVNSYRFVYKKKEAVPYTVKYVDSQTGRSVIDESGNSVPDKVVTENYNSVVTEKFVYIEGYISDAFYKRLTISANGEQNVITFYYTKEAKHARYIVNHWTQNLDGDDYSAYLSEEGIGVIGETVAVSPLDIDGFTFNKEKTAQLNLDNGIKVEGIVTAEGLEINLYYDRNSYGYIVRYLEDGTDKELRPSEIGEDKYRYGQQITKIAEKEINKDETKYTLIGSETRSLTIKSDADKNIITYYYVREKVTIQYVPVVHRGTTSDCTVSLTQEIPATGNSISGAYPIIKNRNYEFAGWFKDSDCTEDIDEALITDKAKQLLKPEYKTAVYYAKFIPKKGELIITSSGAEDIDENQTYIYHVTGKDGTSSEGIDLTVTVHGNSSTVIRDLPVGEYTVTEESEWSWRYSAVGGESKLVMVKADEKSSVEFNHNRINIYWLDGNAPYMDNRFK